MVRESGSAAIAEARRYSSYREGLCLEWVQTVWGTGHAFPDAISQWQNTIRHGDRAIPLGAPVFYGGSRGHVALYVGQGVIRSTDAPFAGRVGEVGLSWPTTAWGHPYLGWGGTLAGVPLPLFGGGTVVPTVYVSKLHYGQTDSDSVRYLQERLNVVLHSTLPTTGGYWDRTDAAVRAFQLQLGNLVDPIGKSSLGRLQAARLWSGARVNLRL